MTHDGWVTAVSFSPDGNTILTASRDGTARLWNAASGDPLVAPLNHGQDILLRRDQPRRQNTSDRRL